MEDDAVEAEEEALDNFDAALDREMAKVQARRRMIYEARRRRRILAKRST